jgi:hypothetical protein
MSAARRTGMGTGPGASGRIIRVGVIGVGRGQSFTRAATDAVRVKRYCDRLCRLSP